MACAGAVGSLGFSGFYSLASGRGGFPVNFFVSDALPYFVAAVAGTMVRTRTVAYICFAASASVLGAGVYTYIDWVRFPAPTFVNDIELSTYPLKWLFGLVALSVAIVGFVGSRTKQPVTSWQQEPPGPCVG